MVKRMGFFAGTAALLVIAYGCIASCTLQVANGTEIGALSYHGNDLRNICATMGSKSSLCTMSIELRVNEIVKHNGKSNDWYNLPADATQEAITAGVLNFMRKRHPMVDDKDAKELIAVVMMCLYPSDKVKSQLATESACNDVR